MRFTERKEFLYDPSLFRQADAYVALKLYAELSVKASPKPYPTFMEVNRDPNVIDDMWHMPLTTRTTFSRELGVPCINSFEANRWQLRKTFVTAKRRDTFNVAHNVLKQLDYFPQRGDRVYFNGYRYMIIQVVLDPRAYWQQTSLWTGLYVICEIPPEGDSKPLTDPGQLATAEKAVGLTSTLYMG